MSGSSCRRLKQAWAQDWASPCLTDRLSQHGPKTWGNVYLPVYYHWEFSTGQRDDFELLVWRLERRPLPERVGKRLMSVPESGFELPAIGSLGLEGALRRPGPADDPTTSERFTEFQKMLTTVLDRPTEALGGNVTDPVVAPPTYGRWQAAHSRIPAAGWVRELNLDPRWRVAAGVGTVIVQDQQEQLMRSAWEQVGEIKRVNQLIRQAQMARWASSFIHQRLFTLIVDAPDMEAAQSAGAAVLTFTAAAHTRVLDWSRETVHTTVEKS